MGALINAPKRENDHAFTSSEEKFKQEILQNSQNFPAFLIAEYGYQEVTGDRFHLSDSFAHCVTADIKMSADITRKIQIKFPKNYPSNLDHRMTPLRP